MKLCQLMTILCLTNYFCTIVQTMPRTDRHVVIQTEDERRDTLFYELFDMISQRSSDSSTFIYSADKIKEKLYCASGHAKIGMIIFATDENDMSLLDLAISLSRADVIKLLVYEGQKFASLVSSTREQFASMMRNALITALNKHTHGFICDYAMLCGSKALEDAQVYLHSQTIPCSVCLRSFELTNKPLQFEIYSNKTRAFEAYDNNVHQIGSTGDDLFKFDL